MRGTAARKKSAALSEVAPALDRIEEIEQRLDAIRREQKALGGPLPQMELAERLSQYLRARRQAYETRAPQAGPGVQDLVVALSNGRPLKFNTLAPEQAVLDFLLFLIGDQVDEWAAEAMQRLEYQAGPSSMDRARDRAALDAERAALVKEHEQLVTKWSRPGSVELTHLPETRVRLDREQAAQHRRERAIEEQRKRREAIDGVSSGAAARQ